MTTGIHALGQDVRGELAQGAIGTSAQTGVNDHSFSVWNSSPQSVEIWTVTVDTAVNATKYTFDVNGAPISYTSDPSATKAEIQAGLVLAYNADPSARGLAIADGSDPDVVITGLHPSVVFPVSDTDANLSTVETQNAAEADRIGFGLWLIDQGFASGEIDRLGALPKSTLLTAQVDDWVLVYDALVTIRAHITVDGQAYTAAIVMAGASDIATEGALLAAAINTALPANTVLASFATATLTLTSEVNGKAFTSAIDFEAPVGAVVDTGAATRTTTGLVTDDLVQALHGISMFTFTVEAETVGQSDPSYPPNGGVIVTDNDEIWVAIEAGATIVSGGVVWVETAVGADLGKSFTGGSATRIALPTSKVHWLRRAEDSRDDAAVLLIRL